jgi:hypothetical protein|tara:strand:- start:1136 stop:1351 length:216 start_codon:yes stop_codon:yes gene_type:complete
MKKKSKQVGGNHYENMAIGPVEYIMKNNLNFLQGNIIKYVSRYKNKGKREDLQKVIQCARMLMDYEYGEEK